MLKTKSTLKLRAKIFIVSLFSVVFSSSDVLGQCDTPMVLHDTMCSSGTANLTLNNTSGGIARWWDASSSGNLLHFGNVFQPNVTTSTTYYVDRVCGSDTSSLPGYSTTYSLYARGYWFIAPKDFYITGLKVPTDVSGTQNIDVMIVHDLSNDFTHPNKNITLLGRWRNVNSNDFIDTAIFIQSGDTIGILGTRGTNNSYASGPFTTTIDGVSTQIMRFGQQDDLINSLPENIGVWGVAYNNSGSIGRVVMRTLSTSSYDSSSRVAANVVVTGSSSYYDTTYITTSDTFTTPKGLVITASGTYADTISQSPCGDSLNVYIVSIEHKFFVDAGTSSNGSGLNWGSPFNTLNSALEAANSSNDKVEIWVKAGTYAPDNNGSTGRTSTFLLTNINTKLYGGFNGSESSRDQRDPANNRTVLSGDIGISGNSSDNCFHVLSIIDTRPVSGGEEPLDTSFVIDGFVISGANANGSSKN
ncbi:MAG: hypothetical protein GC181_07695, partial [Bacteroidetes bacterium]|nr:hypothetical protein [Bacteroidota bacterium]